MEVNIMSEKVSVDIRMEVVEVEVALAFICELPGKWIYTKHLNNTYVDDLKEQIATYAKFKVRNVDTLFGTILIYGEEDVDRLTIDKDSIVSYQMTPNRDELFIQIHTAENYTHVYIKKYLPNIKYRLNEILQSDKNLIITEGKTDWKHLKNALFYFRNHGLYENIEFELFEYEDDVKMGDMTLRKVREYNQLFYSTGVKIFMFDADNPKVVEEHKGQEFIDWGNNVFSFTIPIPASRKNTPLISIEHYYSDEEIKTFDKNSRRLYINSEFDLETGFSNSNSRIIKIRHSNDFKMPKNHIIDDEVFYVPESIKMCKENIVKIKNECNKVVLSKNQFAEYVLNAEVGFDNFNLNNFKLIFDIVSKIQNKKIIGRLSNQEECIECIEVNPIANIRTFSNELKVLEIHMSENKQTLLFRNGTIFETEIDIMKEGVQFSLFFGTNVIHITLPLKRELVKFLHEKAENQYNRIELQLHDENRTRIIEILNGDMASGVINIKLQRMYMHERIEGLEAID